MANIFIPHQTQTAEASLQRSFEQSIRQLERLTRQLMAGSAAPPNDNFPTPDLTQLGVPVDLPPDAAQAELQSRTVAATAAVLSEAYGEGGQYQAEGYSIHSSPQAGGSTLYRVADSRSRQVVLAFERETDGVLKVTDNQLSIEQTQDFVQVAQRISQTGFEPLEKDVTGQLQAQVLGNLAPLHPAAARSVARPLLKRQQVQAPAPVTPLDLVQWRYASIVLGREPAQVRRITGLAQAAAQLQGQTFLQLYQRERLAPLSLQLEPQELPQMHRDIDQLKDLVWQVGPTRVEQLFEMQRQGSQPIPIAFRGPVTAVTPQHSSAASLER